MVKMSQRQKIVDLENENADLKAIIENRNKELEQQNIELKNQLSQVLTKIDQILEENITLRNNNAELNERIATLENLLSEKVISEEGEDDLPTAVEEQPTPPLTLIDRGLFYGT